MEFEPEPYLRFFSISLALILAHDLYLAYFFFTYTLSFLFVGKFCIFSHLGFTYTTYITVKGEFLIIYIFRLKKGG